MGKNKNVTWDGKTYQDFRSSDHDFRDQFEHESGGGMSRFDHEGYAEALAYGHGSRQNFLKPLIDAGIPQDQYDYYAKKAGITNVNSKSDLEDIIKVYNADERYQGGNEGSDKEKKEKKDKYKPPVTTPEEQEVYDRKEEILKIDEDKKFAALQRTANPRDIYSDDFSSYSDRESYDMRNKDKDKESQDFANKYKLGVIGTIAKRKQA